MARKRDRFFALMGALLFLVTSASLTIAVIWQALQQKNSNNNPTSQTAATCQDNRTEPTYQAPAIYKPTSQVMSLKVTDLKAGTGPAAKNGDCLVMKYYGTLASTGAMFDENFTKPPGFAFQLGKGSVIAGWDQGLVGMKAGGERRLVIPANLAYGTAGACQVQDAKNPNKCNKYAIPPNAALVFDVKLLRIQS